MRNHVRFMCTAIFAFGMFALRPDVAYATRVTLVRIQAVQDRDALVAAELTASIRDAANRIPGWTVSTASAGIWDLMGANACPGSHPDVECLHRMAITPGSGAYGPILLHGFLNRVAEERGEVVTIDFALYDAVEARVTHRVTVIASPERLSDEEARRGLASEMMLRLVSAPSEEPIRLDPIQPETEAVVDTPEPARSDHSSLEIAGWSLLAAGIASAIAASITGGLVLSMNDDARFNAYRGVWHPDRVSDVCAAAASDPSPDGRYAASVCSDASALEVLVPLFWTVAGLAAAGGALLAWHPWTSSAETPVASLVPTLGPDRVGLSMLGAF